MPAKLTTTLLLCAALATPAAGLTVASDNFDTYATGALAGNNGGTGWGGAWGGTPTVAVTPTVVTGGLSYTNGDVVVNGGSQSVQFLHADENAAGISNSILSRALASSQSDTVYMSMLFRDNVNPDLGNDFIQWGFDDSPPGGSPSASIMRRNGTFQVRSSTAKHHDD